MLVFVSSFVKTWLLVVSAMTGNPPLDYKKIVLISDIDTDITTSVVSSFADDTRVSKKIGSPDDTEVLQQDLNKIYGWSERNNMQFNDDKFELMRYGTE